MRNSFFFILLLCLLAVGCSGNDQQQKASSNSETASQSLAAIPQHQPSSGFRSISPVAAKQLIESRQDLLVVDVRSPEELRQGSIANSVLIPFWQILRGQHTLPKDKPILLVCAVGGRSYAIAQVLQRQGYRELYNMSGGIEAWKKAGLPLKY